MKICLRCRKEHRSGLLCECGGRIGVKRRKVTRTAADSKILNWLEKVTDEGGAWVRICVSDSRDMGYTKDFVSLIIGNEMKAKGSSLREALRKAAGL